LGFHILKEESPELDAKLPFCNVAKMMMMMMMIYHQVNYLELLLVETCLVICKKN